MLGERKARRIGHPLWKIAAAYSGAAVPGRSTMCSFGRAMAGLRRAGLIEVRHRYDHPYLRIRRAGSGTRISRSADTPSKIATVKIGHCAV